MPLPDGCSSSKRIVFALSYTLRHVNDQGQTSLDCLSMHSNIIFVS